MKDLVVGLIAAGLGLALVFGGYRIARVLIPLWGFFAGFIIGAAGVADALNNGFIGSTMGIVVGFFMGLIFALLAYFFFSLSVILLGATLGYWLGTGFITMLGLKQGFISATVGIILGAFIAVVAIVINAPKYYLIVVTSVGGAVAVATGALIALNKVELSSLSYAGANSKVALPMFWAIMAGALAIVGVIAQLKANKDYELEKWGTPFDSQQPVAVKSKSA